MRDSAIRDVQGDAKQSPAAKSPGPHYDGFISYSHAADSGLAPALQHELERFGKRLFHRRALRIFRDETNLSASPELWPSIIAYLSRARWLLLMASPAAAASKWVTREIQWWLEHRSPDRILLLVTEGNVAWSESANDFDWNATTAIPRALTGTFKTEPLWVDLRWARTGTGLTPQHTQFRAVILKLAAPLHGIAPDELDSAAIRTQRAIRLFFSTGVMAITGLAIIAAYFAIAEREQRFAAERQTAIAKQQTALAGQQATEAQSQRRIADEERGVAVHQRQEAERARTSATAAQREAERSAVQARLERDRAVLQSKIALSRQVAAHSQNTADSMRDQTFLLAAQAFAFHPTEEARSALLRSLHPTRSVAFQYSHSAPIVALSFGPDGKTIASSDANGNVVVSIVGHNITKRALPRSISSPVLALCFCEQGRQLAVGQGDGRVSLWDLSTDPPQLQRELAMPHKAVERDAVLTAVRCLGRGEKLVGVDGTGRIAVWRAPDGELEWHGGVVRHDMARHTAAIGEEGHVVIASNLGRVSLWKVGQSEPIWDRDIPEVRREPSVVRTMDFLERSGYVVIKREGDLLDVMPPIWAEFVSSRYIVVASQKRVRYLDFDSGQDAFPDRPQQPYKEVDLESYGTLGRISIGLDKEFAFAFPLLILPTERGALQAYLESSQTESAIKGLSRFATTSAFATNGDRFAIGFRDGTVAIWERRDKTPLFRKISLPENEVEFRLDSHNLYALDFTGQRLAFVSSGRIWFVDLAGDRLRWTSNKWIDNWPNWDERDDPNDIVFDDAGRSVGLGSQRGRLEVWDVGSGTLVRAFPDEAKTSVTRLQFLRDGRWIVAGRKGSVEVWDVATGSRVLEPVKAHSDWVTFIARTLDGSLLASGSRDKTIVIWDVGNGPPMMRRVPPLKAHTIPIVARFLSPRWLAVGHSDGSLVVWDVERSRPNSKPHDILNEARFLRTADRNDIVVVQKSGQIAIYDAQSGIKKWEIPFFGYPIAVSSDGRWVLYEGQLHSGGKVGNPELLDLDARSWANAACSIVIRSLTHQEWARFIGPETRYSPGCVGGKFSDVWPAGR